MERKKRSYFREITMKQSSSFFRKEQLLEMEEASKEWNIKIAQLKRDSLEYLFSKINQHDSNFSSAEDLREKKILSNSWFTPEQILKCKKIAEKYNVSSSQIRRDAWDVFYKDLCDKKIKIYNYN